MPCEIHCVKGVRIWSYSGPHFPAFGLNTFVLLRIQSECGKMWTRITPNTDNLIPRAILKTLNWASFSLSSYSKKIRWGRGCETDTLYAVILIILSYGKCDTNTLFTQIVFCTVANLLFQHSCFAGFGNLCNLFEESSQRDCRW